MPFAPARPCPRCHRIGHHCVTPDARPSAYHRGYDATHRKLRKAWEPDVAEGIVDCAKCGRLIIPGTPWDLGHTDDRTDWTGPEHAACNRAVRRKTA
jgi:hypothetical protein